MKLMYSFKLTLIVLHAPINIYGLMYQLQNFKAYYIQWSMKCLGQLDLSYTSARKVSVFFGNRPGLMGKIKLTIM